MRPLPLLMLAAVFALAPVLADSSAAPGRSHPLSAKEWAELLPVICRGGVSGKGCSTCPGYTSQAGEAGPLEVGGVTYGHFLGAKETDALIDVSGCEPHVANFGGSVLLRWEGLTRWSFVKYVPGARTDTCQPVRGQGGRDRAVCETYYANMGYEISGLTVYDWTRPDDAVSLMGIESNLGACMGDEVRDLRLKTWSRQGDTLVAQVSEANATLPKGWTCGDDVKLPAPRTYTLSWRWTGRAFVPSAGTRAVLGRLQVPF